MVMHANELLGLGRPTGAPRTRNHFAVVRRGRTARLEADFLDRLVDAELEFIRRLPVHLRGKPAEALAVLVMLAQDHRHYAQGWISRRTLRRRAERAVADLTLLRAATAEELQ
ncbi:MAG TPA: hypothetical protein VHH34_20455 [Pseudonocardiaceae bacterium]|nr:hypothetical protein [Pseudonocardiaceae bacterium]